MYFIILLLVLLTSEINTLRFYDFLRLENRFRQFAIDTSSIDNISVIETKFIEQPLDHFNKSEHRMFKMRYSRNLEFWKPNSTIYVFTGDHVNFYMPQIYLKHGNIYDLANETNGAMFVTEHRYYGLSRPNLDMRLSENLKYLNSRQALADLAYFIKSIKSLPKFKDSTGSKVVVIGGGYGGNLAAWMRLLYPDLVDAAIASSAPVLAKKDFYEFLETVSDDFLKYGSKECHDKIREIFGGYERLLKTPEGIRQLKAENMVCRHVDMAKPENQNLFFRGMTWDYAYYSRTPNGIKFFCSRIMNSSHTTIPEFAFEDDPNFWRKYDYGCFDCDFRDIVINFYIDFPMFKMNLYQQCTEYGHFITTDSDNQPFTHNIPVNFFYKKCKGVFGEEYNASKINEGVKYTNDLYGGLTPNVTRVIFVNGDMDPWSKLGVLKDLNDDAPAIVIPRTSHVQDLAPKRPDDSDELIKARIRIKNLIKTWLNIHEYNSQ